MTIFLLTFQASNMKVLTETEILKKAHCGENNGPQKIQTVFVDMAIIAATNSTDLNSQLFYEYLTKANKNILDKIKKENSIWRQS